MHTWIALDADDSWGARCDKHQRWDDFPQPVYVLAGPGLYETERFLLVSDAPWTPVLSGPRSQNSMGRPKPGRMILTLIRGIPRGCTRGSVWC